MKCGAKRQQASTIESVAVDNVDESPRLILPTRLLRNPNALTINDMSPKLILPTHEDPNAFTGSDMPTPLQSSKVLLHQRNGRSPPAVVLELDSPEKQVRNEQGEDQQVPAQPSGLESQQQRPIVRPSTGGRINTGQKGRKVSPMADEADGGVPSQPGKLCVDGASVVNCGIVYAGAAGKVLSPKARKFRLPDGSSVWTPPKAMSANDGLQGALQTRFNVISSKPQKCEDPTPGALVTLAEAPD